MEVKCTFCGGDCGRVCRGLGFKQSRAKETKGKTVKSDDVPKTGRVSSRLHSGRTEENAAPSSDAGRVAIQDGLDDGVPLIKIGRPKITDPTKMSRSTRYRRKAEERQS